MTMPGDDGMVVEGATAEPWSSLTFTGERHRLVIRLPPRHPNVAIDSLDLSAGGAIVAIERSDWSRAADGLRLSLDLLVIAHPPGEPRRWVRSTA